MPRFLQALYLVWYLPILTFLTICVALTCLAAGLFSLRLARYVSNVVWGRLVLTPGGFRLRVYGREHLPPGPGGFILFANHNSLLDIPAVTLAARRPLCWVAKADLSRVPFFGWALARVHLLVDRAGGTETTRRLMEEAAARLARGEVLTIFPEGTRRRGPEPLLPFKKGAFIMAKHTGARLVPVALKGAGELWPPGRLTPRPGLIRVRFGPPLAEAPAEKTAALADRARAALAGLLADESW